MRIGIAPLLLVLAAARPVAAQSPAAPSTPAPDPIGALLAHGAPGDEDEPDTAGQPRTAPEPEPSVLPTGPAPRIYRPAPRSQPDAPVQIDDTGRTPDGPPALRDMAYDARIRSSFASAESFQGPLDGGWTLSADGQDLYALQLVDRRDRLEGAWRDLRRKGSLNASGLVDDMQRQGGAVTLRFTPAPGAPATVATLRDGSNGLWTGELTDAAGRRAVTLRRTGP
ncbi:MAG: hypothetical protein ACHP9T_13905 [Caulobacterales bacterium]|jgi:hypothetical protein